MLPRLQNPGESAFAIFYNYNGYTGFTPVVGTILPCNLQKGKQYIFKGRLAVRLDPKLVLKPGVCIGENFYVPRRPYAKDMRPDSILQLTRVPETAFYEFSYNFTASGNERYLTFGTFVAEDRLGTKRLMGPEVAMQLQHFSLNSTDPQETLCGGYNANKESIYKYDSRHKEMDYTLYGKGKLPVEIGENQEDNVTRFETVPPRPVKPDTLQLGDVLFDFNKAELKAGASKMLEEFFRKNDEKPSIDSIYIEGHTDSIGSDTKNLLLSQQRSKSVKNWIISNNVVVEDKISIHAFGKQRPVASNKTPAGRALNRRVEIIVFRKEK
jgi:outer membrane protein OmpA-like peptidoglycan-associated protein